MRPKCAFFLPMMDTVCRVQKGTTRLIALFLVLMSVPSAASNANPESIALRIKLEVIVARTKWTIGAFQTNRCDGDD